MGRIINSRYGDRARALIDSEARETVCKMIRAGSFVETAAAHAGVTGQTLQTWLKRGRAEIQRRDHLEDVRAIEEEKDEGRTYRIRVEEETRRDVRDILNDETAEREQPYVDFVVAVDTAIAESELADLSVINKAAHGGNVVERVVIGEGDNRREVLKYASPDWRAAQWKMERRHRQRWGKNTLEVTGANGKPIEVAHTWADAIKSAIDREKTREGED